MSKEKYISVRPTDQLLSLFSVISKIDGAQDINRKAIFERSLRYVAKLEDFERLKVAASQKPPKIDVGEVPTSLKVRISDDEDLLEEVIIIFRKTFELQRVKMSFLMKVCLMAYFNHLQETSQLNEVKQVGQAGIDGPLVFKQAYETYNGNDKEMLFQVCRNYLEETDTELNSIIRNQVNAQVDNIANYYNISKYCLPQSRNFAKPNIIFVTKVLAGLLITIAEIDGHSLTTTIVNLEAATAEKKES